MASALSDGDVAVGIDLGTTFSCVGVFINDHVKIIPNEQGNRITPSMVSFTEHGYVAGDQAKSRLVLDPENTVCESKRLIGRTFDDDTVAEDMKYWPFEVVDIDNKPMVQVTCRGQRRQCSAEEISGIVLTKMKQIAEAFLKQEVKRAVITVPAYFNESQRQATKDAARIAGLEVLRIINEPTAAALAYGLEKNVDEEQHILIFDLGGGTFDVSLLRIDDDTIQVKGTGGDTHLGGADFDNKMVDNSINFFNQKEEVEAHVTTDPTTPQYQRLRRACELAKCQISTHNEETIFVEMFHERINLNYEISRQTFEELIEDRLEKTLAIVRQTLEGENMGPKDIDKVVLIGGSTRIPRLRDQLAEMFGRNKICKSINPDEAVAHGAAVQAAILSGSTSDHLTDVVLLDVTPLSLGISLKGDVMLNIVKRNSLIPCRYHEGVTTVDDKQTRIRVNVYQGERPLGKDNHLLGEFVLKDIPPEPPGVPKIDVTFELDVDGCLTVKATDKKTRNSDSITIEPNKSRCSDKDIQRILEDAKEHLIEDIKEKQRVVARNKLDEMATWLMYILLHHSESLGISPATNQGLLTRAKECDAWIKHNTGEPREAYTERLDVLKESARCVSSEYRFPGKLPNQQNVRVIGGYGVLCYSDDDESDTEVPEID